MDEWPEDMPIPLDHPLVPEPIRRAVLDLWKPGDNLHRVETDTVLEWWLLDAEGTLIEAFWLE
ncbi:MAG: hypothetical protein HY941_07895 [Gammaproteobacteria bacterium]|nr:hypothetical protein [Gammaproteobacteria bacterium]